VPAPTTAGLGVVADGVGRTAARTCFRSFGGTTLVLMADESKKPIKDIKVGDRVIATDPETGECVTRKVTHVWVHDDQLEDLVVDLEDLVVDGKVITTTEDHLFWSVTDQKFEKTDELAAGEVVFGDGGRHYSVSVPARNRAQGTRLQSLDFWRSHLSRRHRRDPRPQRLLGRRLRHRGLTTTGRPWACARSRRWALTSTRS